ncbi:sigma-70 family RNA polymerase sigma factor [Bradyrhizobium cenepequi]|uniref:sigma-70 family RNA polymerase sigma factor n=1 Tax=Bradyrhizobium cenepequi TaxID=2821403 RepID=UPI001CE2A5C0|nr:sigma-70 family RNA polymerase sigma factor [Bradyrhizobium cenepequi]MCA6111609.1 sigma-70 family RNA polymerase sigma factor [Bradyrhizobium cenepequi]
MTVEEREQRWAEAMRAERRGEAVAYERMLKEVATALRRSLAPRLARVGLGGHEAEDLVQEILIGLHSKRDTWDPARSFLPWLHAIARYKLIDFMRQRRRDTRRRVDLPLVDWLEMVESPADEANCSTWEVDRHLAVLPVSQRKIVRAIAIEGASVRNVARGLATSEGAVRMTLHRAIRRLLGAAEPGPAIEPPSRDEHDKNR